MIVYIDLWLRIWNFKDTNIIELLDRITQQFRFEEAFGDYPVQTKLKAQVSSHYVVTKFVPPHLYQGIKSIL